MVERIDRLGFSHLWLTDSSLHARNSYAYLTLAATHSSRLRLGHRGDESPDASPRDHRRRCRNGGRDLRRKDDPRDRRRGPAAHGARHATRRGLASLRASIEAIRELWSGGDVSVQDDAFVLERRAYAVLASPDIPIYVSASGPKILELAGEIADGVILLVGLFPEALAWALEHVERGAAKAGRPRPHVAVFAYGAIDEDGDAAHGVGAHDRRVVPADIAGDL